jgi:hypothetical protein
MSSPIIVPSLPAGYDVLQPALATKVCASPHSLACSVGYVYLTLLHVCSLSYSLLSFSLQWLSVLDASAQGRFKFCSHAAWIAFTPRSLEAIRRFLSHLGRSWKSIDYIDYDVAGFGRLLCFVPSDCRVAEWGETKCFGVIRGTSPTPALKNRAIWRNDLTFPVRDSSILPPEHET